MMTKFGFRIVIFTWFDGFGCILFAYLTDCFTDYGLFCVVCLILVVSLVGFVGFG